jgi:hypothetical protein
MDENSDTCLWGTNLDFVVLTFSISTSSGWISAKNLIASFSISA